MLLENIINKLDTKMSVTKSWCFTINNYTDEDIEIIKKIDCVYIIAGLEIGEQGTKHIQGYISLKKKCRLSAMKKIHNKAHWEAAKGNSKQNKEYCSKEGNILIEKGTMPKAGKRTDVDTVKEIIKNGGTMKNITDIATNYQCIKIAEAMLKYNEKSRNFKPLIKWYYGTTGTGKTRQAFEELGFENTWISGKNLRWWEGYDAHENVIIDDFRADFCTFHELLRILDRYPYRVETKGGSRQLVAKTMIITSAYHPSEVYKTREDIEQLLRRIDSIEQFGTEMPVKKCIFDSDDSCEDNYDSLF